MEITAIDEKWIREIHRSDKNQNSNLTFCGALESRYRHIAKYWNSETRKKNERIYNNIILPALPDHNNHAINEYTKDDYDATVQDICNKGYVKNDIITQYSDSYIDTIKYLILTVVFHASAVGYCNNVLWGSSFELTENNRDDESIAKDIIKKSLDIRQETLLIKHLLSNPYASGEKIGILLMLALGVRDAESCGLNYGDIKPLYEHADCTVAWIYKTTKINSNSLQASGKTYNTGRLIPVPEKVLDLLALRKKRLIELLYANGIENPDVDEYPICSKAELTPYYDDFKTRCSANDITYEAHEIYNTVGISSRQIAYIDAELSDDNMAKVLHEKDPSAYLLRRNYATHLHILGLCNAEIQYLIGHVVEDAYESRNDYVDDDRIYQMHLKLRQRPLVNTINETPDHYTNNSAYTLVNIKATEPFDSLKIKINCDDATISYYPMLSDSEPEKTINIITEYQKSYKVT